MAIPIRPAEEKKVACEICLNEVPISSAKNEEVQDYVIYFCGIECFGEWKQGEKNLEQEG